MPNTILLFTVALSLILFSLWYLRYEYRARGRLTGFGSFVHVAMYAIHGMFSGLLLWGPVNIPPMGSWAIVGIVLMVLGLSVTVFAMDLFRSFSRWLGNGTPGLATNGLYRYSRNPQFVGYGMLILGFTVAWWKPSASLILITYALLAYCVASLEEEHLTRVYGQSYVEYCAHVPRFLGLPK